MRRFTIEEWDREIAPLLGAISIRIGSVISDVKQIAQWVDALPAKPDFESEAIGKLNDAAKQLKEVIEKYETKETVG